MLAATFRNLIRESFLAAQNGDLRAQDAAEAQIAQLADAENFESFEMALIETINALPTVFLPQGRIVRYQNHLAYFPVEPKPPACR